MKKLILILVLAISSGVIAQEKHFYTFAKMNGNLPLEGGGSTTYWGFGTYQPSIPSNHKIEYPSPTLEVNQNDSVFVHFWNESAEDHTIHLHGLDVDQANDGVPSTSQPIANDDSTVYAFKAKHPGLFIYHCHVATPQHISMGMYGMIVVLNSPEVNLIYSGGPSFNKSYNFLSSDFDLNINNNPTSPGPFHEYDADYFMVNGKSGVQLYDNTENLIEMAAGDSVLLRIGNMGYTVANYIFPSEANAIIYTSDGRVLPNAVDSDTVTLYPGERFGVLLTPTTTITDWLVVENQNITDLSPIGTNYIGINRYNHPNSIEEPENLAMELYPNPTTDQLNIQVEHKESPYTLINQYGKVVKRGTFFKGLNSFSCADLDNGIYLLYTPESGVQKVVVSR